LPPSNASEDCFLPEEVERARARRVYRVSISGESVSARVAERLNQIGKTVRLPGFRPGKIPEAVLQQRYGAKARSEAIQALGAHAADQAHARGELAASLELMLDQADSVEFRLEVTHLAELADIDFAAIEIERLSASRSDLDRLGLTTETASKLFDDHCRRMVLDSLDKAYRFPIAPQLIAREHALIRRAADEALAADSTTLAEREAIESELGAIAERRVRLGAVVAEMARRHEIRLAEDEILCERRGGEAPAQTWDRLREDKLIRLVMSKARVTDREATAEELRELADAAG
jgi:FKBP-type peptidyl-prolyl cis-trans isomerase (trigger factor)